MAAQTRSLQDRQDKFIAAYRNCCNVRAACDAAGIPRRTVYSWVNDPDFKQRLKDAHEDALDVLEAVGWQRARKSSDRLLEYFLTAGRPEKYGRTLKVDWHTITDEQLRTLAGGGEAGMPEAGYLLGEETALALGEPDRLPE